MTLTLTISSNGGERLVREVSPPFVIVSNFLWRQWGREGFVEARPGELSAHTEAVAVIRAIAVAVADNNKPNFEIEVRANNFIFLNGRQLYGREVFRDGDFIRLANGGYMQIGSITIPTCEVEATFLKRIDEAPEDEENRVVYADWLEQQGRRHRYAEVLRLDACLVVQPDLWNVRSRLSTAARDVPRDWRLRVCRLRTPSCPEVRCPRYWHRFQSTDEERIRLCANCGGRHIGLRVTKSERLPCAWEVEDPAL